MRVLLVGEYLFVLLGIVVVIYIIHNLLRARRLKRIILVQQKQKMELQEKLEEKDATIATLRRDIEAQKILIADKHTPKDVKSSDYRN